MSKKSTQIAIGGVFSGLCLALMFLTGMVPFSMYALPAIAGAMLVAVVVENGRRTAFMVYLSVSILAPLIVPNPEAAMMFIAFFGYYPIIQGLFVRIKPRLFRTVCKLLLFNVAIVGSYWFGYTVLGMTELLEDIGDYSYLILAGFLLVGNVIFVMYDFILTRYTIIYVRWFKPRFLRR